jgi:hypothetical protein
MDKIMWLKVIREELAILDRLAAGMIEDAGLTREEVELAITRSKIVANEFEVLYKQIPVTPPSPEIAPAKVAPVAKITAVLEPTENVPEKTEAPAMINIAPAEEETAEVITPIELPPAEVLDHSKEEISEDTAVDVTPVTEKASLKNTIYIIPEVETAETLAPTTPADQNVLNMEDIKEHQPQFKAVPLKSLKDGLSLNDRYLFQRELFDNDKTRLDETVAALDALQNIQEAVAFLKANFKWIKSEASEKFVHLVKRRFS